LGQLNTFIKTNLTILLFVICELQAWGTVRQEVLKTDSGTIVVSKPNGWTIEERVLGIPFVFFSPKINGQRSNVSFTHTGQNLKLNNKALLADFKNYKLGKKQWADKVGAKIIKVLPLKSFQNTHGHNVTQIGVSYKFKKKSYIEKSYYIECGQKLLHSKALTLQKNKTHHKLVENMIKGIDCAQ
jgi:hypothetical protein